MPTEVTFAGEKTDANGVVVAIGKPRLAFTRDSSGHVAVSAKASLIATNVANAIDLWDLATGVHKQRLVPKHDHAEKRWQPDLRMSPDAGWIAGNLPGSVSLFQSPFHTSNPTFTLDRVSPLQFSADSKFLAAEERTPAVVDLVQRKIVATAGGNELRTAFDGCVSTDGQTVWIAKRTGIERWDRGANKRTLIYKPSTPLEDAVIASGQRLAVVADGRQLVRVDLATGTAKPIGPFDTVIFAVSASGQWVALSDFNSILVVDTDSGAEVWKAKARGVGRVAFAPDAESLLVYDDNGTIRVADVPIGVRTYPEPTRFAGWLADGVVAVRQAASFRQLTLATLASAGLDAKAIPAATPTPPSGSPSWATWVSADAVGPIAGEPVERYGVPIELRYMHKCPTTLRVWTVQGGERTLRYTRGDQDPDDHFAQLAVDPCWYLGGGRVLALSLIRATVFDPVTGKRIVAINVGTRVEAPEFPYEFYAAALSATGTHLALLRRGADLPPDQEQPDPRRDVMHINEAPTRCEEDLRGDCELEYIAEMWSLSGTPKRLWRHRFDADKPRWGRWLVPKIASGAIAFTRDGTRVLFGFDDGDIEILPVTGGKARVEHLHRAPIRHIEVGPGDTWVFSSDRSGEHRAWQMPASSD